MSPALLLAVPVLGAFVLPSLHRASPFASRVAGPLILVVQVALVAALWQQAVVHGPLVIELGGLPAPMGIAWQADQLGLLWCGALALLALVLWPREGHDPNRAATLTLLLVGAGSGLALSADLFNLFVLYELTALASFGLVVSQGTGAQAAATLRFLLLGATGSALALLGIALIYAATGTLNLAQLAQVTPGAMSDPLVLTAFALLLAGLGVKAELFPLNTWVPEVYGAASPRVAGLLAGAVSKLALLVVLRLLTTIFADTGAAMVLLGVAAVTVLAGELAAYRAQDLRRMLAYSSIGQLGLMALAFSVSNPTGIAAGLALGLHHLLVKPALFVMIADWPRRRPQTRGLAAGAPWSAAAFVLLALSLVGVPPLPGFWAKLVLLQALLGTGGGPYAAAAALVLVITVVEAGYLIPLARQLYSGEPAVRVRARIGRGVPLILALLLAVVLIGPVAQRLDQVASSVPGPAAALPRLSASEPGQP